MLRQCFCVPPKLLIFASTFTMLFVSEFGQEALVHPHRPPGIFALLLITWDKGLVSLEELMLEY